MKVKIAKQVQFKDASGRVLSNYQVYYKGRSLWISEKDFENHKELMSIEDDELMLCESVDNYYKVDKRKNKNGEFLVILPKENVAKSYSLDPAKRLPKDMAEEVLTEYKIKGREITSQNPVAQSDTITTAEDTSTDIDESGESKSPKEIENSFREIDPEKLRGLNLRTMHLSGKEKESSPENSSSEGPDDLVEIGGLTLKESQFKGIVSPEELEGWLEDTGHKKPDVPEKLTKDKFIQAIENKPKSPFIIPPRPDVVKDKTNATGNKKVISAGSAEASNDLVSADQKIKFINSLITLSTKQKIDEKTRERLFGLVGRELEKAGSTEEEILKELNEIKNLLFLSKNKESDLLEIPTEQNLKYDKQQARLNKGLHRPKDVSNFMHLFEKRDALKWLTHEFDSSEEQFEIETFLTKAKAVFDNFIDSHYIPRSLFKITHEFAFSNNPHWGEKLNIKQGWSSPSWIDWSKSEKMHPMKNNEYYEVVQEFRKQTRIESPNLESLIQNEFNNALKGKLNDWQIELIDCQKADFYTNTYFFRKAISLIFDGIGKRASISKRLTIKYIRDVEGADKKKIIKICHHDSFLTKPVDDLINEISRDEKGDFNSIKRLLFGFCDWHIETKYDGQPIRLTILGDLTGVYVDLLESDAEIEGFTHYLIFYTK